MNDTYFFTSQLAKKNPLEYVKNKTQSSKAYINYMLLRLQKMFKYNNLPDTIPKHMLELYLMNNGSCFITKVNSELYALTGSCGGEPDPYYKPTRYIVANPALKLSADYDIDKDGVLMRNDSLWFGLYPLMARYASLMSENILTIRTADVMLRVIAMFTAPDDKTKVAAESYLKKLENGELGVIAENRFFDGIKMQSPPSNNGSYLTQFIELHQYLKGSFFNEIGLNANFNMKREAIGDGETSLNEDSLLPLCDEMLKCRQEDFKKVNEMFGTNISVEFDSAWANNKKEILLQFKQMEHDSQLVEKDGEYDESKSGNGEDGDSGVIGEENSVRDDNITEGDDGISTEDLSEKNAEGDIESENQDSSGDRGDDESFNRNEVDVEININIEGKDNDE